MKIKARIDYATRSVRNPRFSMEMEFNDDKHLQNFLDKANREGKKIIGHEILSDPCVYIMERKPGMPSDIPIKYAREYGRKVSITEFEKMVNDLQVIADGVIKFDNLK